VVELKRIPNGKPVYFWGSTHTQTRKIPTPKNREAFFCSRRVFFIEIQINKERERP